MFNFHSNGWTKINMVSCNLIQDHLVQSIDVLTGYNNITLKRLAHIFCFSSHVMIQSL